MERAILRQVQIMQLDILREIDRVCRENHIKWFLCCGTLLGAVRHNGFIPWDDDLDIGMLREDYDKFCRLAPEKLDKKYSLQSWYTEKNYALPFAKVRMRNTLYIEAKSRTFQENGFFIDIFPFDYAPESLEEQKKYAAELNDLFRLKLMKDGYKPWIEKECINLKKRMGYFLYQLHARKYTQEEIIKKYDALAAIYSKGETVYRQRGLRKLECYPAVWFQNLTECAFEGELFPVPEAYEKVLTKQFGDYMVLPPENEREDRHQIVHVDFGDGRNEWRCES